MSRNNSKCFSLHSRVMHIVHGIAALSSMKSERACVNPCGGTLPMLRSPTVDAPGVKAAPPGAGRAALTSAKAPQSCGIARRACTVLFMQ